MAAALAGETAVPAAPVPMAALSVAATVARAAAAAAVMVGTMEKALGDASERLTSAATVAHNWLEQPVH